MSLGSDRLSVQPAFRRLVALAAVLGLIAPLAAWQPGANYLGTIIGLLGLLALFGFIATLIALALWTTGYLMRRSAERQNR